MIPDRLGGFPVGYINCLAKYHEQNDLYENNNTVESITFPDSVWGIGRLNVGNVKKVVWGKGIQIIGTEAFAGCENLTDVTIPDTVAYIGASAFYCCIQLKEIIIPNSVTCIREQAFSGCSNLCKVLLSNSISEISIEAFSDCISLKEIVIPDSVAIIEGFAFSGCTSLEKVKVGNSVTEIGYNAFACCDKLKIILIPKSVVKIDSDAFECVNLNDFYMVVEKESYAEQYAIKEKLPYAYSEGGVIYNKDEEDDDDIGSSSTITGPQNPPVTQNPPVAQNPEPSQIIPRNSEHKQPSKGEIITDNCYKYEITGLDKPTVAFSGITNKKLAKITIPESIVINGTTYKVTSIANGALKNNKKLTSVVIGKNVTTIGKEAFKGSSKLKTITIKSSVLKKVGKNAFKGIDKKASIKVPKNKKKAYQKLLKGKGQSKSVKIK